MKNGIALSLLLFVGFTASAGPDLEKQAEKESTWKTWSAPFEGFSGSSNFAVTESGGVRLIELGGRYGSALKLNGRQGLFKGVRSDAQLTKACATLRGVVDYELENKNLFTVTGKVNPLSETAVSNGIADASGWRTRYLTLETEVADVRMEPVLSFVNNSTPVTSLERLKVAQAQLTAAFRAQYDTIKRDGEWRADLKAFDDVACDLINGNITLDIRLVVSFDAAYVRRHEILSARDLQGLQSSLQSMGVPQTSGQLKIVARAANLGVLLQQRLGSSYDGFMQNKFAKMVGGLIDLTDGSVPALPMESAAKIARKLDDLSTGKDTNQTVISLKPEWNY